MPPMITRSRAYRFFSLSPDDRRAYSENIATNAFYEQLAFVAAKETDNCTGYPPKSNRQYLWIKIFYAASSVAVVSSGRSTSLPFSNFAPARTSATRWGALTARQRDWAASISL